MSDGIGKKKKKMSCMARASTPEFKFTQLAKTGGLSDNRKVAELEPHHVTC